MHEGLRLVSWSTAAGAAGRWWIRQSDAVETARISSLSGLMLLTVCWLFRLPPSGVCRLEGHTVRTPISFACMTNTPVQVPSYTQDWPHTPAGLATMKVL